MTRPAPFSTGEEVRVLDAGSWQPGHIVRICADGYPEVSYIDSDGTERVDRFAPSQIKRGR